MPRHLPFYVPWPCGYFYVTSRCLPFYVNYVTLKSFLCYTTILAILCYVTLCLILRYVTLFNNNSMLRDLEVHSTLRHDACHSRSLIYLLTKNNKSTFCSNSDWALVDYVILLTLWLSSRWLCHFVFLFKAIVILLEQRWYTSAPASACGGRGCTTSSMRTSK